MTDALDPRAVAARLESLRATWVPLDAEEARRLMTPVDRVEPFPRAVARRLDELRALVELTRHLHAATKKPHQAVDDRREGVVSLGVGSDPSRR